MCGRILEAYRTGHGQLTVRGKVSIEQLDKRSARSSLIISEVGKVTNRLFQHVLTCFIYLLHLVIFFVHPISF